LGAYFTDGRDIALLITAAAAAAEGPFIFLSSSPAVLQMMGERILSFLFQRTRNRTITTLFSCCLIYISMIPQQSAIVSACLSFLKETVLNLNRTFISIFIFSLNYFLPCLVE